ncbi:MAG: hypothetical protein ACOC97_04925 [Myxococcota bacterium]
MPLPTLLFIVIASGFGAALAAKAELRVNPRPSVLTRSFAAYVLFLGLVVVPVSVYFYTFHGDWFLLYLMDVRRLPSALALVGFLGEGALGVGAFALGAALVRGQREGIAKALVVLTAVGAVAVVPAARDRLAVVGTFAQYHGDFGLHAYGSGALLQGTIAMGLIMALGLAYLVIRLHLSGNR